MATLKVFFPGRRYGIDRSYLYFLDRYIDGDSIYLEYDKKRYEEAMSMARKAEETKDSAGALMNYWRAADANPKSADAYLGLARAYLARGEKASAVKSYETARKLGAPQNVELEQSLNSGSK